MLHERVLGLAPPGQVPERYLRDGSKSIEDIRSASQQEHGPPLHQPLSDDVQAAADEIVEHYRFEVAAPAIDRLQVAQLVVTAPRADQQRSLWQRCRCSFPALHRV